MAAFAQHQGNGVERVLRKELCTSENDRDEPDGIEQSGDEVGETTSAQLRARNSCGEAREPHGDPAGEAGDGQTARRAAQLLPRILFYLNKDLDRGGSLQVLLYLCCRCIPFAGEVLSSNADRHDAPCNRLDHDGMWQL